MSFLSLSVEAMPSITSCCLVMGLSHASHTPLSTGPPQNLGMLLYGRRPSVSFSRMTRQIASASIWRGAWLGSGECCTLYVPEGEAPHVELKGRAVVADTLHGELGLRDDLITSDTAFAVAGTARDPSETVARQITAFESPSDEKAQRLWVRHGAAP